MRAIFLAFFLFISPFLFSSENSPRLLFTPTFAQEQATPSAQIADIGYSKIHPASPFYFLKAIRENLELRFAGTYHVRMLRQLEFATRRLREVNSLTGIDEDLIPPTMERYGVHISSFTDKHQDMVDLKIVSSNLTNHLNVMQQIYNKTSSLKAKMFIRSAMNKVIQRADVTNMARNSICNFFLKEASSSALNQTEQLVLLNRVDKCRLMLLP